MRLGKRAALDKTAHLGQQNDQLERVKASIRAKVEHPLSSDKAPVRARQGALSRVEKKNIAQLNTLFALANLSMARKSCWYYMSWPAQKRRFRHD